MCNQYGEKENKVTLCFPSCFMDAGSAASARLKEYGKIYTISFVTNQQNLVSCLKSRGKLTSGSKYKNKKKKLSVWFPLDGTLIHYRLASSRCWYSSTYPRRMESWVTLGGKEGHTKIQILAEPESNWGSCDRKARSYQLHQPSESIVYYIYNETACMNKYPCAGFKIMGSLLVHTPVKVMVDCSKLVFKLVLVAKVILSSTKWY